MSKEDNLDNIIQGCLRHERTSQEKLFKYFYSKMMTVCLRYGGDRDTAKELLQDSFIKIFDKLEKYVNTGSFEGWVKRVVTNTCIDHYRRSKKDPIQFDDDVVFHYKDDKLEEIEIDDLDISGMNTKIILDAVSKLSPQYRTVFNLFVIEEYSHKEIAEMLNISEGTSKSNLAKAKARLQMLLKDKLIKNY